MNMTNFFEETTNAYWVAFCKLNNVDCAFKWTFVQTYLGKCLKLHPDTSFIQEESLIYSGAILPNVIKLHLLYMLLNTDIPFVWYIVL